MVRSDLASEHLLSFDHCKNRHDFASLFFFGGLPPPDKYQCPYEKMGSWAKPYRIHSNFRFMKAFNSSFSLDDDEDYSSHTSVPSLRSDPLAPTTLSLGTMSEGSLVEALQQVQENKASIHNAEQLLRVDQSTESHTNGSTLYFHVCAHGAYFLSQCCSLL